MNCFDLKGKKAIVTGGSSGLGKGMVEGLLEAGAEVVIVGVSDRCYKTCEEFKKLGYRIHSVKGDVGEIDGLVKLFNDCLDKLDGTLDIMINNAGIQRRNKIEEFILEDWNEVINVNLTAVFQLCKLAGVEMMENGGGKIINIASMLSFFGGYTVPAYAASKGGVAQLTKALANEWASKGINVNAIAPGYMNTDMNTNLIKDKIRNDEILSRIPQKRWGTPEDIKGITIFLASSASNYVNGAIIPLDGGYLGR